MELGNVHKNLPVTPKQKQDYMMFNFYMQIYYGFWWHEDKKQT